MFDRARAARCRPAPHGGFHGRVRSPRDARRRQGRARRPGAPSCARWWGSASPRPWPRRCWPRRGVAQAQPKAPAFTPTKRGGGGPLRVLWWQAPTLLNPHFATGTKDIDACRIFYEPLAAYDPEGNLAPVLAAEIPSVAQRHPGQGPDVRHLAAQEERHLARRQALHRRRRHLQLGVRRRPGHRRRHQRLLRRHRPGRQGRCAHGEGVVQEAAGLLGRRLLRQPRRPHSQARLRALQGGEVPRGARQPQARGHRGLQVRGLQAGRHRARRDESQLPRGQPPLLRHPGDEGGRRRGVGGPRRAPDRRVRLRLEHAGGGRHPAAPRAVGQGAGEHLDHRGHRAHPVQLQRSRGPRSTASAPAPRPPIRSSPTRRCGRPSISSWTAPACRSRSTAARARPRPTG